MKVKKTELSNFIANQITGEGLDELQRTLLCAYLGHPMANDGPKGAGKTETIRQAAFIMGKYSSFNTKVCGPDTQESHLIAGLAFEQDKDGNKNLIYQDRVLCRAAREGSIAYLDEINLLENDLQKRCNSLIDDRKFIEKANGERVAAKKGFWFVCSYNPTKGMFAEDLDESVADRMIHIPYSSISPQILAKISYEKAKSNMKKIVPWMESMPDKEFPVNLEKRGVLFISGNGDSVEGDISSSKHKMYFVKVFFSNGTKKMTILNFFNNSDMIEFLENPENTPKLFIYDALAKDASYMQKEIELDKYEKILSYFCTAIKELAETGKSTFMNNLEKSNRELYESLKRQDYNSLMVHVPTSRIQTMAIMHLYLLIKMGAPLSLAQQYASRIVIDQISHGSYRYHKLTNITVEQLIKTIASLLGIYGEISVYNTELPKNIQPKPGDIKKSATAAKNVISSSMAKPVYFEDEELLTPDTDE